MSKKFVILSLAFFLIAGNLFADNSQANIKIKVFNEVISTQLPKTWRFERPALNQRKKGIHLIEFLPKSDNFDNWKEMFTIQGFNNLAVQDGISSINLEKMMKKSYQDLSKENFIYKGKTEFKIGRHHAVLSLMGCSNIPQNMTTLKKGEGEIGLYLFVKGKQDVYIIHKSWKTEAFKKENFPIKDKDIKLWKDIFINKTKFL